MADDIYNILYKIDRSNLKKGLLIFGKDFVRNNINKGKII